MAERLRLFILAGEPSGDRLAADLIRRLKARVELAFSGVGGDDLIAEGLKSLFPMRDLAVMGISDVLRRLPLLLWRIEQTARAIRRSRPDIVVLVDAQDFSRLLASRLKALGYAGKLILYVAPTVWARAPERAPRLRPLFDEVLAVLPFEPRVMAELGGPKTSYVGHPALAEQLATEAPAKRGPMIIMPGSRDGELRRHLSLFRGVMTKLHEHAVVDGFVIPTLGSLLVGMRQRLSDWPIPVVLIAARADRRDVYQQATLALTVAGTATLELALARVPMVVSYVMDRHQARVFGTLGRPYVSLPNIILNREVVPELIQSEPDADALEAAVRHLLDSGKARENQITAFGELARLMDEGERGYPREDPADRVLSYWSGYQRLLRAE